MGRPQSRSELLDAIDIEYEKLTALVEGLSDSTITESPVCGDWTVKDLLAHLHAWHEMFLSWERIGASGGRPDMPAAGFTWRDTPALNEQIWRDTKHDSLSAVEAALVDSHDRVRQVVSAYDDNDLFTKRRFPWTGSTSVGSYAASATSSHYSWATGQIRRFIRQNKDTASP